MSAFTEHRTIIATLFLPTSTAAAFHPNPQSLTSAATNASNGATQDTKSVDRQPLADSVILNASQKSPTTPKFNQQRPGHARHPSSLSLPKAGAPSSIIEELISAKIQRGTDGGATSPNKEKTNPFATFATSGKKLENINEDRLLKFPASVSQAVSTSSSDSEEDRVSRPRTASSETKNGQGEQHGNQSRPGSTQMYRRLSRKKSRVCQFLCSNPEVHFLTPLVINRDPNHYGSPEMFPLVHGRWKRTPMQTVVYTMQ
jgi:hypothetical protein